MKDLSSKIFKEIKTKSIKPTPAWCFSLKEEAIWSISLISIFFMVLSFGIIVSIIFETDWEILDYGHITLMEYLTIVAPYFWFAVFVCSSYLFFWIIRKTRCGYRIERRGLIIFSFSIIILMAFLMQIRGYGLILDKFSSASLPIYDSYEEKIINNLIEPEKGFIVGRVVMQANNIYIKDYNGQLWLLDTDNRNILNYASSCQMVMVYGKVENNAEIIPEKIKSVYKSQSLIEYHPGCK
ncbi:MAG: hypothetical protein AAB881_00645 [Patescibacteria group bacterium]